MRPRLALVVALSLSSPPALVAQGRVQPSPISLDSMTRLQLVNARALWVDHRGRPALQLAPLAGHEHDTDQEMVAILTDTDFEDGVIELDVSGARRAGYATDNASAFKGFVGISFRVHGDSAERMYVRPENAYVRPENVHRCPGGFPRKGIFVPPLQEGTGSFSGSKIRMSPGVKVQGKNNPLLGENKSLTMGFLHVGTKPFTYKFYTLVVGNNKNPRVIFIFSNSLF